VTSFLAAVPALADTEYVLTPPTIDWRLVVVLTVIALGGFYLVLEGKSRAARVRHPEGRNAWFSILS
jgi:hypothetical protein